MDINKDTIRSLLDRHLASLRSMIQEAESIQAQFDAVKGELAKIDAGGSQTLAVVATAVPAIETVGTRRKTPTRFYATVVDACRAKLGLGPVVDWGPWLKAFQSMHSTCCGNDRWGAFVIVASFNEDAWVDGGCRADWFRNSIDRLALQVKREMSRERDTIQSGPVGLPPEETVTPEESKGFLDKILSSLKRRSK